MTMTMTGLSAQERFVMLRGHVRAAEAHWIEACYLLGQAHERREWIELGLEDFAAYYQDAGLTKSAASKMLAVARTIPRRVVEELPRAEQEELSVERLYVSSQRVQRGQVSAEEAVSDAVSNPTHELINLRDGRVGAPHRCVCPNCGDEHYAEDDGPGF